MIMLLKKNLFFTQSLSLHQQRNLAASSKKKAEAYQNTLELYHDKTIHLTLFLYVKEEEKTIPHDLHHWKGMTRQHLKDPL